MIVHDLSCVFVHVPKTAGQSIEQVFLDLAGLTWSTRAPLLLRYNEFPQLGPQSLAHLTAEEYIIYKYLSRAQFKSYLKFGFVRNPWDRAVSEYYYRKFDMKFDFRQFLLDYIPAMDLSNLYLDSHRHIIPQARFLYDDNGVKLVDYIGRFEFLDRDFARVCDLVKIERKTLPHRNRSAPVRPSSSNSIHTDSLHSCLSRVEFYRSHYDKECRQFIRDFYEDDITLFGYRF